ncbi:hypothetical protein L6164_015795 [Bauhinia variegata]|uniref:Uncharacterized protein n=1 Tax=Bauhinia variegata TaxID=167791 RepID=A0ACB9NMR4_BAUVA|nr:hypothetical protein L6164_015795 [Bauhinia variegata]
MLFHKPRYMLLSVRFLLLGPKHIPFIAVPIQPFFLSSDQPWLAVTGNPLIDWPSPIPERIPNPNPNPNYSRDAHSNFSQDDFSTIANLFTDSTISPGPVLETALDGAGIEPGSTLLQAIFDHFDSSPNSLYSLLLWAEKQAGYRPSMLLFNSMINVLAKSREFDSAWTLLLNRMDSDKEVSLVSADTFAIMIRRYAGAGKPQPAIRTFEFARNLKSILDFDSEMSLFEIMLDSLCKEGSVRAASEYFLQRKKIDPRWVPSTQVYNIILNGWFRSRKLKQADRFWATMRKRM